MIEWWQTGVIGVMVFVVVLIADRISARADERKQRQWDEAHGPYPCFTHMGTTVDQRQIWCHEMHGHDGPHTSEWGLTQAEIDEDLSEPAGVDAEEIWPVPEWKAQPPAKLEDHATFENLRMARPPEPEQVSSDIDSPGTTGGLCTYGENGAGNEEACWKEDGHDGPHMVQGPNEIH